MAFLDLGVNIKGLNEKSLLAEMKAESSWWKPSTWSAKTAENLVNALDTKLFLHSDEEYRVMSPNLFAAEGEAVAAAQTKKLGVPVDGKKLKNVVDSGYQEARVLLGEIDAAEKAIHAQRASLVEKVQELVQPLSEHIRQIQTPGVAIAYDSSNAGHQQLNKLFKAYAGKGKDIAVGTDLRTIGGQLQESLFAWREDRFEAMGKLLDTGASNMAKRREAVNKLVNSIQEKTGVNFTQTVEKAAATLGTALEGAVNKAQGALISGEGEMAVYAAKTLKAGEVEIAKDMGIISEAAYKEKGILGRFWADGYANLTGKAERNGAGLIVSAEKTGWTETGLRGGAAALGAYLVLNAAGKATGFAPTVDENNQVQETNWPMVALQGIGGAAMAVAALKMGGGARGAIRG